MLYKWSQHPAGQKSNPDTLGGKRAVGSSSACSSFRVSVCVRVCVWAVIWTRCVHSSTLSRLGPSHMTNCQPVMADLQAAGWTDGGASLCLMHVDVSRCRPHYFWNLRPKNERWESAYLDLNSEETLFQLDRLLPSFFITVFVCLRISMNSESNIALIVFKVLLKIEESTTSAISELHC